MRGRRSRRKVLNCIGGVWLHLDVGSTESSRRAGRAIVRHAGVGTAPVTLRTSSGVTPGEARRRLVSVVHLRRRWSPRRTPTRPHWSAHPWRHLLAHGTHTAHGSATHLLVHLRRWSTSHVGSAGALELWHVSHWRTAHVIAHLVAHWAHPVAGVHVRRDILNIHLLNGHCSIHIGIVYCLRTTHAQPTVHILHPKPTENHRVKRPQKKTCTFQALGPFISHVTTSSIISKSFQNQIYMPAWLTIRLHRKDKTMGLQKTGSFLSFTIVFKQIVLTTKLKMYKFNENSPLNSWQS